MCFRISHAGCNSAGCRRGPAAAENAKTGAAIKNKLRAIGSSEFKTRGVTAIAPRRRIHGWRGAANAPEAEFCDWATHHLPGLGAWLRIPVKLASRSTHAITRGCSDTRSGGKERQLIRGGDVSNCVISTGR